MEQRRAAIVGYVYGSFRVRDLVERTVGDPTGIRLRLVDIIPPEDFNHLIAYLLSKASRPTEQR